MSMIPVADATDMRGVMGQTPAPEAMPPGNILAGAAMRQSNSVVSILQAMNNSGPFQPEDGYSALPDIKGSPYFDNHSDRFAASASRAETDSIKRRIDAEEADKKTLAAAGGLGVVASMVAGTLDPTMLLPGRVAIGAAKEGAAFVRGAKEVGAAMAVQATLQEAALQASQETRKPGESVLNIASATVLGALLGGTAVSLLAREGKFESTVAALDRDRAAMAAHVEGAAVRSENEIVSDVRRAFLDQVAPENLPTDARGIYDRMPKELKEAGFRAANQDTASSIRSPAGDLIDVLDDEAVQQLKASQKADPLYAQFVQHIHEEARRISGHPPLPPVSSAPPLIPEPIGALESTVGAATSDTRKLELVGTGTGLEKAPLDPMSRLLNSSSPSARRAAVDLAEPTGRFKENLEGIATSQGPALDRLVRMATNQTKVAVGDKLDELWKDLRFAGADAPWFAKARDAMGTLDRPPELPNFDQFKHQVSDALRNGDQHPIPQVQEAAQFLRAKVFDPWKERAIKAGLLPEGIDTKTADSYLQRIYNKQSIAAQRPEFVNTVQSWLKGDQEAKAGAQTRINAYHGALKVAQEQISKAEARIAKLSEDAEVIQARAEETTRLNKFAFQRSEALRESEFRNEGGIRVAVPGKNIEKARGGAVFETKVRDRGNVLSDQASAKLAEIDALEQRLVRETANHDAMRAKIEDEIAKWEGQSVTEAKAALKARADAHAAREAAKAEGTYKGKGERLSSADDAVDSAVRRIQESDRDISSAELRDRAHQITERILGSPDGRLPYDEAMGGPKLGAPSGGEAPRGPLAAREFNIPDAQIAKWLENDIEHIISSHLRTMVPDVLLTERFGDVAMTESFRKIEDEFANLIDATKSEAQRTKLGKQREAAIRDLAAIRDRVRGIYGMDAMNSMRGAARVAAAVKNYNVISSMGMATVSSLPDIAGATFRHGLGNVFRDAYAPFARFLMGGGDEWKQAAKQFRAMGIATESVVAQRHHALSDIMDNYRPQSRLERTLQFGADKMQFANLLAPWTDWGKINASMVAGAEILRAAKAATERTATKRQIAQLAESGIDGHMAEKVWGEFSREGAGEVINGVHLPNTDRWQNRSARDAFEGAVSREADIAIVTPGQEKPLWLSNPLVSVIGQFKSFTAAATQRILIANLQRADAQTLQGVMFSLGLGMVSYKLNSVLGGQPTSDKPQDWIKEAISRGSLLGWLEEGNALASKMTRGGVDMYRLIGADKPLSRYAGRSVLDQMLGPTAGKVESLAQVTGAIGSRDWKESDTKAVHKLTAFGNVFWLRNVLNQVEVGANNAFGVPMKAPTQH